MKECHCPSQPVFFLRPSQKEHRCHIEWGTLHQPETNYFMLALSVGWEKNFVVNLEKFNENKQVRKIKYVCFEEDFFFCFNNRVTDLNSEECG